MGYDIRALGETLRAQGYDVTVLANRIDVTSHGRTYDVFGDDDVGSHSCYVDGVMVDMDLICVIRSFMQGDDS
jgi:hypothetical protein